MDERVLPLEGVHNFRDYGGYAMRGGARLKSGLLFRSGQHVDATEDDLGRIDALALRTVIDLRGDSERASYPCARSPAFAADVLFAPGETVDAHQDHDAPHIEAARNVRTAADAHAAMTRLYAMMPWRPNLVAVFRHYVDALAHRPGASLLHCLAGKDRTGVAAGLFHTVMGVHPDDVMEDYLLTNVAGNAERRIAAGAATVRANFGPAMQDDAVRTLMSVHADFLTTSFAEMKARHGSIEGYAADILGVTPDMVRRMEERFAA